jgi:hypothetical protein
MACNAHRYGAGTMMGGRLKRILSYVQDEEMFCLIHGDGVLRSAGPEFGALEIQGNDQLTEFTEKHEGDGRWSLALGRTFSVGGELHRGRWHQLGARTSGAHVENGRGLRLLAWWFLAPCPV